MKSTARPASSSRPTPQLRVRRDAYQKWQDRHFKGAKDYQVAEHYGLHKTTFSLVKNGHTAPTPNFIAATLRLGGKFEDLFETVAVDEQDPAPAAVEQGSAA